MNYSKNSMFCYLIKCGVSDVHAMTLTNMYGDNYTSLHATYRSQGYGNQSKAMAILFMTDFHTLHDMEGRLLRPVSGVYDENSVFTTLMNTISAFTCHALVSAYALGEDRSKQVSDNFSQFIKMLIDTINKRGIEVSHDFS